MYEVDALSKNDVVYSTTIGVTIAQHNKNKKIRMILIYPK
jgi:hypothetical protein